MWSVVTENLMATPGFSVARLHGEGLSAQSWLALAATLAVGVLAAELLVHVRLLGVGARLSDLAGVALLGMVVALPLAGVATRLGLWLVGRLRWTAPAATAAAVAGLFALFLCPAALVAVAASGPHAGPHGPATAVGVPGALAHALLDAGVAWLAGFTVLSVLLAAAEPGRGRAQARESFHRLSPGGRAAVALALVAAGGTLALGGPWGAGAAEGQTRTYYIAADEVAWDYAPSGRNEITGEPFDDEAAPYVEPGPERIGSVYRKALYREYTDATFTRRKPIPPEWQHLGALGPVIHAAVGDTVVVVFRNNTAFPASVHAHGVFYRKDSEGAVYNDGTGGADKADDAVAPGDTYTYTWHVPERAGPGPSDGSSVLWMYHSHVNEVAETNAGLIGPIIVTARGAAKADGSPADVDREFVTLFDIYDENVSPYLDENMAALAERPVPGRHDGEEEFAESNLKHSINGFLYGNLSGLTMRAGERVRWYVLAMGSESGLHTPHWHGQTLLWHGMRMDGVDLLPMSMKVLDMVPDNPGTWWFHCHVNDHLTAGMSALFTVRP